MARDTSEETDVWLGVESQVKTDLALDLDSHSLFSSRCLLVRAFSGFDCCAWGSLPSAVVGWYWMLGQALQGGSGGFGEGY